MGKILGKYKVLLVTIVLLLLTACSAIAELDEHVVMVKNGHPELYPELEYGDVFEEFFDNPTWEYFKSPQIQFITFLLISKAFEDYADKHNIKLAKKSDDIWNFDDYVNYESTDETEGNLEIQTDNRTPPATVINETEDDEEIYNIKADGYYDIFPDSNARYLDYTDVGDMDAYTIRLGLNEIYARHGRKFNDANLQNYFNSQPWYTPVYTPDEFNAIENSVFNAYEKANVKFLADLIR